MKKFIIILVILGVLIGGFFGYKLVSKKIEEARIEKIKEGWYIEIKIDKVKIRKDPDKTNIVIEQKRAVDFSTALL